MLDLLIIGAGPGGCAAAIQAQRLGLRPRLLDLTGRAGGLVEQAWRVENYPGLPPLSGPALARLLGEHLDRVGVEVHAARVAGLLIRDEHVEVQTAAGSSGARAVIAAVGTAPLRPDLPGAELLRCEVQPVLACSPGAALVIGGGESALDFALSLAHGGARVHLLVRGSRLRARGRLAERAMAHPGVHLSLSTRLLHLERSGRGLEAHVRSPRGSHRLAVDAALAAIGRRSRLDDLAVDGGPSSRISTRLHVVGDARSGSLGQVGMAVGEGLAAAMAVARELGP